MSTPMTVKHANTIPSVAKRGQAGKRHRRSTRVSLFEPLPQASMMLVPEDPARLITTGAGPGIENPDPSGG